VIEKRIIMNEISTEKITAGASVKLISAPDGAMSKHYPLTVGNTYEVKGFEGSNVITTTDEPGRAASYWIGRVVLKEG
jgi:hypothetical protein